MHFAFIDNELQIKSMNEYIQKYGENAVQAYKKSLRMSQSLERDKLSPTKQQFHFLPKKSLSKRSLKSKRNESQTRLGHSKSIKNVSKMKQDSRNKTSSFYQASKKIIHTGTNNALLHTFNKINNAPGKKKLTITESNTPKSRTPKLHFNLNLHKQPESQKQTMNFVEAKDKLTERIQHSSGNKKFDKCSTSQSKHHSKRSFLNQIQVRLQETLCSNKKTLKNLSESLKQSFGIILMKEEDLKLRKTFLLMKQVIERICGIAQQYKSKYTRANQKIHSLQMVHQTYLANEVNHSKSKSNKQQLQNMNNPRTIKKASIEMIILNENYDLRRKNHKLQKQLEYYTSQSASLMNVFGKFKNNQSQLRMTNQQVNYENSPNFPEHKTRSNNKLQKRRSSENLFYYNSNNNPFSYGGDKRLSFDPGVLEIGSQAKKSKTANLYSSVSSSISNEGFHQQDEEYHHHKNYQNRELEELSEQQDSDDQE